jgi:hypothetical protein
LADENYVFAVTSNPASQGGRFSLVLIPGSVTLVKGKINAQLLVAPNPAKDRFEVAPSTGHLTDVRVLDMTGRVVFSWKGNQASKVIDAASWPTGVYSVQATTSGGMLISKLEKE